MSERARLWGNKRNERKLIKQVLDISPYQRHLKPASLFLPTKSRTRSARIDRSGAKATRARELSPIYRSLHSDILGLEAELPGDDNRERRDRSGYVSLLQSGQEQIGLPCVGQTTQW